MRYLFITMALLNSLLIAHSQAEVLQIPISQQAAELEISLPQLGDSQSNVLNIYGEPSKRHPSIGQPPITRWDYLDFSVYFEYQTVISSVKQHRPKVTSP